jgi:flagellar basal-body rod protein FlgB
MFSQLTQGLDFQSKALVVRAERQRLIASNIANADTPGYSGRDINFKEAMAQALGEGQGVKLAAPSTNTASNGTHPAHLPLQSKTGTLDANGLAYTVQTQPAMDGNSVDMDRERSSFVDNAVRYEATLRFINGHSKTILSAIQGQ